MWFTEEQIIGVVKEAGAEITKQARNWIGNKIDATKRSQVIFMDRDDILNLVVVTNLPLTKAALLPPPFSWDNLDDDIPFWAVHS